MAFCSVLKNGRDLQLKRQKRRQHGGTEDDGEGGRETSSEESQGMGRWGKSRQRMGRWSSKGGRLNWSVSDDLVTPQEAS